MAAHLTAATGYTSPATRILSVSMFTGSVESSCRQCGKPAVAWLETEQGRLTACREHVRLAVQHFARAHGIA